MTSLVTLLMSAVAGTYLPHFISNQSPTNSDPCGCDSVLLATVEKRAQTSRSLLQAAELIDHRMFEVLKREASASLDTFLGSFGLSADADWSHFEAKRQSLRTETRRLEETASSSDWYRQELPVELAQRWLDCKRSCNQFGLTAWIVTNTADTASLYIAWRPTSPASIQIEDIIIDGGRGPSKKTFTLTDGSETALSIAASPGSAIVAIVKGVAGGRTFVAQAIMPKPVAPPSPPQPTFDAIARQAQDWRDAIFEEMRIAANIRGQDREDKWRGLVAAREASWLQLKVEIDLALDLIRQNGGEAYPDERTALQAAAGAAGSLDSAVRDYSGNSTAQSWWLEADPLYNRALRAAESLTKLQQ